MLEKSCLFAKLKSKASFTFQRQGKMAQEKQGLTVSFINKWSVLCSGSFEIVPWNLSLSVNNEKEYSTFCCDTCSGIAGGVGFIVGVGLLSWGGTTSCFSVFGQSNDTCLFFIILSALIIVFSSSIFYFRLMNYYSMIFMLRLKLICLLLVFVNFTWCAWTGVGSFVDLSVRSAGAW